jgi:hypothetical protein
MSFLASNFAAWVFDKRALSASNDSSVEASQQASSNVLFRSECHWSLCCHEYRHVIRCSRPRSLLFVQTESVAMASWAIRHSVVVRYESQVASKYM